jgi:aspartate carbamoyltransferase catalytic subunit
MARTRQQNEAGVRERTRSLLSLTNIGWLPAHDLASRQSDAVRADLYAISEELTRLPCESSTRTRTSFEVADKRLSGGVINMLLPASAMVKGETLIDTAMTLNAMHPDVLVARHPNRGRFICCPRRSTVPSSMPATAATGTRQRRCSTR